MSGLRYQTIQVGPGGYRSMGPTTSPRAGAMGGAASLLLRAQLGLLNKAYGRDVAKALDGLQPEIRRQMPGTGGVLIVIGYYENRAAGTGDKWRRFSAAWIGATGLTIAAAIENYKNVSELLPGEKNYRREFIWVSQ